MATPKRSIIWDAMVHLKRQNGATFGQIRKHLESTNKKKLNPANKKILSSTLQGLLQSGLVEKNGATYKLGLIQTAGRANAAEEQEVPARRRRKLSTGYKKTHRFRHKARRTRRKRRQSRRRRTHHRRRRHHKRRKW